MNKFFKFIVDKDYRFRVLSYTSFYNHLNDKTFLERKFKAMMGRELLLDNPITYNEKIQWLKLNDRKERYVKFVDKILVRDYVKEIIGEEYLIPLLGVWEDASQIDIESLPNQFVLKCNHNSGRGICICRDKKQLNTKNMVKQLNRALSEDYYLTNREWPYKYVKRRILAERFIGVTEEAPVDYKFYVMNGKIDSVMLCLGREKGYPSFYFYDMNWNRLYYQNYEPEECEATKQPQNFDKMIEIVKKLSQGFITVRVDLYNIDGKIYFGELTLYNQSGYDTDISYETDVMWGKKLLIE